MRRHCPSFLQRTTSTESAEPDEEARWERVSPSSCVRIFIFFVPLEAFSLTSMLFLNDQQTGENHETALAGEFMRVLRDAGVELPEEMLRFPSTIKKREHGSYGAFFKDIGDAPAPKKTKFFD